MGSFTFTNNSQNAFDNILHPCTGGGGWELWNYIIVRFELNLLTVFYIVSLCKDDSTNLINQ